MKNILISNNSLSNLNIESILNIREQKLEISFIVKGMLTAYVFPQMLKEQRLDELWKATSFELFLANTQKEEYYELNFSPSLAWNFYYLNTYRADVTEVENLSKPKIAVSNSDGEFKIVFEFALENLEMFDICNIACIVLNKNNERTFWSVKHQSEVPDFHERKNFFKIT